MHKTIKAFVNQSSHYLRLQCLLVLGLVLGNASWAQLATPPYVVVGQVTDQRSGEPVPFASIAVVKKSAGTTADEEGRYSLQFRQPVDSLLVSAVGYQTQRLAVSTTPLNVTLVPSAGLLSEVVVRAGENPAFHILREIDAHRKQNDFKQLAGYEYDTYSQLSIRLSQMADSFRQRKPVQAILRELAKKQVNVTASLPVFLSETTSRLYARNNPQRLKEQILKTNINSLGITDDSFVAMFTGAGFNTLNFYQNQVGLFRKEFMSPLAKGARSAYTYFLADTTEIEGHMCYGIDFDPKNERDLVLRGRMWIDTLSYALFRIEASVGPAANINFVRKIELEQTYALANESGNAWLPDVTRLTISVGEVVKNTFGATVDYVTAVQHPVIGPPRPVNFFDTEVELAADRNLTSTEYWQEQRKRMPATVALDQIRAQLDTVRNLPIVRTYTKIGQFILNGGNLPFVRGVDVGSVFTAWARNPIEGDRIRIGLQTNNVFSRQWQLSAYGAYGTRDRIWKTGAEINFIPTRRPLTLLTLKHSYDLEQLGLRTEDLADNAFFRLTSRFGPYPQGYYQRESAFIIQRDLGQAFTQIAGVRRRSINPVFPFGIHRITGNDSDTYPAIVSKVRGMEYFVETRYMPGRMPMRRVKGQRIRRRPGETAPSITFRYAYGISGFRGGTIGGYHQVSMQWDHALRWGILGRTQYTVRAGYTPSTVPYSLLQVHLGNQTPFYNRNAFNLMNYGEFVSDRYVSIAAEHKFEGLFTNRLPLIRRWGWRSFATGNVLWGGLSEANKQLIAPVDAQGLPLTPVNSLQQTPYVELGYGLENVFKLVRIEALHRLTYRELPNVTPFAVKVSFQLSL